jgi:hypothetical protein
MGSVVIESQAHQATNGNTLSRSPRLSSKLSRFCLLTLCVGALFCAISVQAAPVASFEIIARDGRLSPERLEVPANVKLRLTVRNEGKVPMEFESIEVRVEKIVSPNSAGVVVIQPLKPGTYTFFDDFHHETGKLLLIAK